MSIERILEQLKKEKDPLKYLENELDKIRGMITAEPTKYGLFYSFYKLS